MSREFGSYETAGYFHSKIDSAATDCENGRDPLTKLWGEFLREFCTIAYGISTSEACDSGPHYPIMENIKQMKLLEEKFKNIQNFIYPYERVAEEAVSKALEGKLK